MLISSMKVWLNIVACGFLPCCLESSVNGMFITAVIQRLWLALTTLPTDWDLLQAPVHETLYNLSSKNSLKSKQGNL